MQSRLLVWWMILPVSVNGFIRTQYLLTTEVNPPRDLSLYFADVSRPVAWNPTGDEWTSRQAHHIETRRSKKSREDAEAVNRMLLGYDAKEASQLSDTGVTAQMELWADKSGVVGRTYFGDELYERIIGMSVCRSSTLVGSLAHFWQAVVDVIHEHADEFNPIRRWDIGKSERNQVFMIVFPNCQELYDYKTMKTLNAAVEFSKGLCLYLGRRFSLTLFHPKYKNSPRMFSLARHSPFPSSGLHFAGHEENYIEHLFKHESYDTIQSLKQQRLDLEILINSAAGSSPKDDLSRDVTSRNDSRRYSKGRVIEMSKDWINSYRFTRSKNEMNPALQFADTIDDRWTVTDSKVAEDVYAQIWKAISDLYDKGVLADEQVEGCPQPEVKPVDRKRTRFQWMRSVNLSFLRKKENLPTIEAISSMFVSTKFCAFNAQSFKSFSITVNAALKRLTNGRMFLEVFHPEYVGNKGYNSKLRRAPFPTIQICYEVRRRQSPWTTQEMGRRDK